MKIQFASTFEKSLKRLIWRQSRTYKFYSLFRYDIPLFIKNIWRFRKELWNHQWWDYRFNLEMLYRSLSITYEGMKGDYMEVPETREPKLRAMERALELLKHKLDDDYVDRVEEEIGPLSDWDWEFEDTGNGTHRMIDKETPEQKAHNRLVFNTARELEEIEWKELWEIFKGTKNSRKYGRKYDGTDMRGWWD